MLSRRIPGASSTRWRLAALLSLVVAAGCGRSGLYRVEGKVVFPDGTPLTGGTVVFGPVDKDALLSPRGELRPDGTFQMSTHKEGDGAPEGKYRVLVAPLEAEDVEGPPPPSFDRRFSSFDKSGLEYTVQPGKNDFFTITIEKRQRR
ncbi:MAG: hypothetical protein L0Z62_02395 [Gemmataceae bacterium]|nr:hypothetical protein [Gemmataceae bacterium]